MTNQSINQKSSMHHSVNRKTLNQSINQSTTRATERLINQSINHSGNRKNDQSTIQLFENEEVMIDFLFLVPLLPCVWWNQVLKLGNLFSQRKQSDLDGDKQRWNQYNARPHAATQLQHTNHGTSTTQPHCPVPPSKKKRIPLIHTTTRGKKRMASKLKKRAEVGWNNYNKKATFKKNE